MGWDGMEMHGDAAIPEPGAQAAARGPRARARSGWMLVLCWVVSAGRAPAQVWQGGEHGRRWYAMPPFSSDISFIHSLTHHLPLAGRRWAVSSLHAASDRSPRGRRRRRRRRATRHAMPRAAAWCGYPTHPAE